ncbi:GNAT family N-acetyltransferase [Acidaminobacter sp. JC074]|uniref:GNAT family N-acetyltransferase n=1 Tax=Acidaminobacter sp. JC074 TaxID=2530199 RepID=UPI001F0E38D4|nr:GNAT family N-acetyltransferase [Acidaminobacter sp. JC074]MCH4890072.1 GNAT family N-acetyltransferase [Acidaminobacter sp. JC074]
MDIKFIKDYKNKESLRKSFSQLALDTFGIHFEKWYEKGLWNDKYVNYSYVDGEKVISNVSINKMHVSWEGKTYTAIQIGTVMTDPDYRKKGLAYKLLQKVMEDYTDKVDFIYLFGNDLALDLYKKFDMHEFKEHRYMGDLPKVESSDFRKISLDNQEDFDLMMKIADERSFLSDGIGTRNDSHLTMFYASLSYYDCIYYSSDLDVIVILDESEGILNLYDVLSTDKVDLPELIKKLPLKEADKIEYHFKPIGMKVKETQMVVEDQTLLIRHKQLNIKESFRFPAFSHA